MRKKSNFLDRLFEELPYLMVLLLILALVTIAFTANRESEVIKIEEELPQVSIIAEGKGSWYNYECMIWDVLDSSYKSWVEDIPGAIVLCKSEFCTPELKNQKECYSQRHYTCASRDFKRGTMLYIENIDNGNTTTCRVNDYVENPDVILDLSSKAFAELAPLSIGIINIKIYEGGKGE
jgi:hypothetical protein